MRLIMGALQILMGSGGSGVGALVVGVRELTGRVGAVTFGTVCAARHMPEILTSEL